jgi:RHS repeat-associated protein
MVRYTGKERDEETGFTYHGARYYAHWLGRWMSADPIGLGDGTNVYAYVRGNTVTYVDPGGMQEREPDIVLPPGTSDEEVWKRARENQGTLVGREVAPKLEPEE